MLCSVDRVDVGGQMQQLEIMQIPTNSVSSHTNAWLRTPNVWLRTPTRLHTPNTPLHTPNTSSTILLPSAPSTCFCNHTFLHTQVSGADFARDWLCLQTGFYCIPVFAGPTLVSHFSLLIQKCKLCINTFTSVCFQNPIGNHTTAHLFHNPFWWMCYLHSYNGTNEKQNRKW